MQIELSKIQNLLDWIKIKIFLDSNFSNAMKRVVRRCEVYKCNFGIGIGSEIQKERPCVVVQNNLTELKQITGTTSFENLKKKILEKL